jgi:uncharacterized protein (TIGR00730 family)
METPKLSSDELKTRINQIVSDIGVEKDSFEARLIGEMIYTCCNLHYDEHNTGQLKLINHSLRELRYAFKVFNQYPTEQRLSIFGSARTPDDHPDYIMAKEFSERMALDDWMCITGAAGGIMKAGHEGSTKESIFGLSIRLTFEQDANIHIEGDPKHINFKYFFTRKLMFLAHSDAVAVFPGGFGTMDELFEVLTLIQTGKSIIIPIVLLEGNRGTYWDNWIHYVESSLVANKTISPEDMNFFHKADSVDDAVAYIEKFYSRYHSSRYVKDLFVIRLRSSLTDEQLDDLNEKYASIIAEGKIEQRPAFEIEDEYMDLPRLAFNYTRSHFGRLRQMIDQINNY